MAKLKVRSGSMSEARRRPDGPAADVPVQHSQQNMTDHVEGSFVVDEDGDVDAPGAERVVRDGGVRILVGPV